MRTQSELMRTWSFLKFLVFSHRLCHPQRLNKLESEPESELESKLEGQLESELESELKSEHKSELKSEFNSKLKSETWTIFKEYFPFS